MCKVLTIRFNIKDIVTIASVFLLLMAGCTAEKNEVLQDDQMPPEDQLMKVTADKLASDFSRGKKKSLNQANDAERIYSYKWLKVTGTVASISDKGNGLGYSLKLETFAADPSVVCVGNLPENVQTELPAKGRAVTIVGKLVSTGNASTLDLNPCKFL